MGLVAVSILFSQVCCDSSKPTGAGGAGTGVNKAPEPEVWIEEAEDHVRLYEFRRGPNNERINHGRFLVKTLDDKVRAEGFFADGKETGIWRAFYADGKVLFEGEYLFGEKNGEWVYYDESGAIDRKELYVNGKLAIPIDSPASTEPAPASPAAAPATTTQPTSAPATTQPAPAEKSPTYGR